MPLIFQKNGAVVSYYCGAVLRSYEHNGRDDSDFYAVVWDIDEQKTKEIEYDTTRYGGGGNCIVDARPEHIASARQYASDCEKKLHNNVRAEVMAKPHRGAVVKVAINTRGKKAKFTNRSGEVRWIGPRKEFNPYPNRYKTAMHFYLKDRFAPIYEKFGGLDGVFSVGVMFDDEDECIYFDSDRLEVVQVSPSFPPEVI